MRPTLWLHLSDADPSKVEQRLNSLVPIWEEFTSTKVAKRSGQALEIAIYRAMLATASITTIGGFQNVDGHDDSSLYSKQEIHHLNGNTLDKESLDFIALSGDHFIGIEAKNIRPWIYPHDEEIRAAIRKAITLDVIPVIIARRIQYASFRVFGSCGVVMHETYNQRMANADAELAAKAKHKDLLGYHDIRLGNLPDARLARFFAENLTALLDPARAQYDAHKDLLAPYAFGEMTYAEFAARVRRRRNGQYEDGDWPTETDQEPEF